jgi:Flp pilus assembly protein TadG
MFYGGRTNNRLLLTISGVQLAMSGRRDSTVIPACHKIRLRSESGQNLVEFVLLLPLLILILFGVLDLGRLFHAAIAIDNAAREGARFAADAPTNDAGIQARVQAEAQGTGIDLNDNALTTITKVCPSGCSAGLPVRVTVTYQLDLIVPGVFGFAGVPVHAYAEMVIF